MSLAEALLLEREGAALTEREGGGRVGGYTGNSLALAPALSASASLSPAAAATAPAGEEGAAAGATETEADAPGSEKQAAAAAALSSLWNDDKAAQNQRRLALLAKSLESNDVHNLQVLRRSLELQVKEEVRSQGTITTRSRDNSNISDLSFRAEMTAASLGGAQLSARDDAGGAGVSDDGTQLSAVASSADGDARWHAEILDLRLAAVARAVENKGGWRSAVFLDSGEVNVDVDAGPWPPEEGVLMLQTVRDALAVQLMEVNGVLT